MNRRLLIRSEFLLVVESGGGAADHLLYAGAKWPLVKEEGASERSSPFRDGVAGLIEYDSTWATKNPNRLAAAAAGPVDGHGRSAAA